VGLDQTKTFLKKSADLIPPGENVRGVIIAEAKGGAWRRGLSAASALGSAAAELRDRRKAEGSAEGAAAEWPESPAFWLVLTDKQLHAFEGRMNSSTAGPAGVHLPFDRIASAKYNKKLMISKLEITFDDGSAIELDVAKQKTKPFVEALESQFGAA
jgi:hypothetical protein